MDQRYFRESFTRRRFFPDLAELPSDAVQQVTKRVQELQRAIAQLILRLHGERLHAQCFYPRLVNRPGTCTACTVIMELERLLLLEVYGHIDGVVIDFLHEPEHRDQLEAAIRLYAWSVFHQCEPRRLVREPAELIDFARYRVGELYSESFVHKPLRGREEGGEAVGLTSEEDLEHLSGLFASTYAALVDKLDAWRGAHPGVITSAFPADMFELMNTQLARDPVTLPYSRSQVAAGGGLFTLLCHEGRLTITYSGEQNLEGAHLLLLDERKGCLSSGQYTKGKALLMAPKEKGGYILQIT